MKPNFALSLSFEGIRLLHRSGAGWTVVGEVPLDEPDLAGALAALRATAVALEPQGLRTKLLLPADQVRRLDAARPGEEGARAALEGATPYAVADLVIDHAVQDGRNRVAAVWTGTLDEAEAFATEHRFHPVCFAAVLPDDEFPGEAFFGESRVARSGADRVERDRAPTVPRDGRAAAPLPAPADDVVSAGPGGSAGAPEEAVAASTAALVAPPSALDEPAPRPVPDLAAEPAPPEAETSDEDVERPAAAPAADADAITTDEAGVDAAPTDAVAGSEPRPGPPAEAPLSDVGVPEPVFSSRARPTTVAVPVMVGASRVPLRAPARLSVPRPEPARAGSGRAEPPVTRAARLPQRGQPLQAPPPPSGPSSHSLSPPPAGARAAPAPALRILPSDNPPAPESARPAEVGAAHRPPTRPGPRAVAPPVAPAGARVRGRPRFLGLILTVVLLVAMLAVGVWASSTDEGVAGLFRRATAPAEQAAAAPAPEAGPDEPERTAASEPAMVPPAGAAAPDTAASDRPASASPAEAPDAGPAATAAAAAAVAAALEALPAPQAAVPTRGAPVTPDEADRVYAATGVWLRAPALPAAPRVASDAPVVTSSAEGPRTSDDPQAPLQAAADPAPASPGLPPPAGSVAAPEGLDAASAVVIASAPPLVPPTRPGTSAPPAAALPESGPADEAAPSGVLANAMAETPGRRPAPRAADPILPDSMRQALAQAAFAGGDAPAPVGTAGPVPGGVAVGALGPIEGTPQALAGLPDALAFVSPPEDGTGALAGAVALVTFEGPSPAPRPTGLAPEAPPAPEVLAAYEGPRPGPRPDGLAPESALAQAAEAPAAPEAAAPDPAVEAALAAAALAAEPPIPEAAPAPDVRSTLASIMAGAPDPLAGATPYAVASARVPESRPRSFDRVVRDQLARSSRAAQPAAAAASAAPRSGAPEDVEASDPEVASAAAAAPSGATPASVSQVATYADAMALREINLIGVFGQPSDRRALVRMGNGSYLRVGVGDRLDGGQVTAIGDNALNYTKRGRTLQLVIPGG